ncbi:MAG: VCBS repeat-containing protein [Leadbetterella sp.]
MKLWGFLFSLLWILGCKKSVEKPLFSVRKDTGLDFVNSLKSDSNLNIFNYMYFYNGGGVGSGDFNKDGLPDLVFTANQSNNHLYINKGNLKFEDITSESGFVAPAGWSSGVSVIDINQDGMLDLYISRVGKFETLEGHNLLFVCKNIDTKGIPHFEEKSKEYGLDLIGFGTQAAFFDQDEDGDLDFYQLNHSVHQNGTFGHRDKFLGTYHPLAGDRYFENQGGKYVEKTVEIGINSSAIGYGLGIALGDVNLDGKPDMYIGNDFHENDYLYINQGRGKFKDELMQRIDHTSRFTMGVDITDLNNDIFPEIFTLDMLPYDPKILKRSEGEDVFYNFKFKLAQGYNPQFARNNLQVNHQGGYFSEIGMYSGIHATDWSWSTLLFDFDHDGKKDVFISNGINKRMNDLDYINFVSSDEIQNKIAKNEFNESDKSLIDLLPEIKIPNKFYQNGNELKFTDIAGQIEGNENSFSNGCISLDLDKDGDLDIVTNNINQACFLYENHTNSLYPQRTSFKITLKGSELNKNAIGAKCVIFAGGQKFYQEKFPVRGFLSSSEEDMVFGINNNKPDSIWVIWPDNTYTVSKAPTSENQLQFVYKKGLPKFNYERLKPETLDFKNISKEVGLEIVHEENDFNEFDRDALIPNMMSSEGPALAVGDVNGDGREDVFFGGSRSKPGRLFIQSKAGKFINLASPGIKSDSSYEDIDAQFVDIDKDKDLDLIVASGGSEFPDKHENLVPRLYKNDGKGNFLKEGNAFSGITINAQSIALEDINKDGFPDVFLGARCKSWFYGEVPDSYLLLNNGKGQFLDVTQKYSSELKKIGFVKDALWQDINSDGKNELIIATEWDGIFSFTWKDKKLQKSYLTPAKGWWNCIIPMDIDKDQDVDFICGNMGQNSRLQASNEEPVSMYINDFDKNERLDHILTYYLLGNETVFADKRELEKQLPYLKKKYIEARKFANASVNEIVGASFSDAKVWKANTFSNVVLVNDGKGSFIQKDLPGFAQRALYKTGHVVDVNKDGYSDLMMLGNFYECNIQMGLFDSDYIQVWINDRRGGFYPKAVGNVPIKGQFRKVKEIEIQGKTRIIAVRNNDKAIVLAFE